MLELDVRRTDTVAAPPTVELRPMRPDDWPAVAEIYWDGMRDGLATFETQVPTWEDWDANHLRDQRLGGTGLGDVVGWAALGSAARRRGYAGVTGNTVSGARAARRLGGGRKLLAPRVGRRGGGG